MSEDKNKNEIPADEQQQKQAEQAAETAAVEPEVVDTKGDSEDQASDSKLEQKLAEAQGEIAKLKDAFLRAKAEEDNIRRRSEKEIQNSRKFALEGFAKELLTVWDSLKMASSVEIDGETNDNIKNIQDGVALTFKQLETVFTKFGLQEVTPEAGDKLDPNLHQAMSLVESEEVESGQIISVMQSGFSLNERLIRPAMVIVAK